MEKNVDVEPTTINKCTPWEVTHVQVNSSQFLNFFSFFLFEVFLCSKIFVGDGKAIGFENGWGDYLEVRGHITAP